MVLRLLGGELKGTKLLAPAGTSLRPTSARRREAVLDILRARLPDLEHVRAADVFAGTGAVGFELLSAGAAHVTFIENDPAATALIRRNAEALGVARRTTLLRNDATRLGPARAPFDVLFLDPPYGKGLAERVLRRLVDGGWLAPAAVVLVEIGRSETLEVPAGLVVAREHRHGAGRLVRLAPVAADSAVDQDSDDG